MTNKYLEKIAEYYPSAVQYTKPRVRAYSKGDDGKYNEVNLSRKEQDNLKRARKQGTAARFIGHAGGTAGAAAAGAALPGKAKFAGAAAGAIAGNLAGGKAGKAAQKSIHQKAFTKNVAPHIKRPDGEGR